MAHCCWDDDAEREDLEAERRKHWHYCSNNGQLVYWHFVEEECTESLPCRYLFDRIKCGCGGRIV